MVCIKSNFGLHFTNSGLYLKQKKKLVSIKQNFGQDKFWSAFSSWAWPSRKKF